MKRQALILYMACCIMRRERCGPFMARRLATQLVDGLERSGTIVW